MTIQKIKAGRVNGIDADSFVGDVGQLFYNEGIGDLRVSDGVTAGGIPLSFGGGGGGNYTLPTATTTVKGGVKIDGSTITIANQVIGVGTVPYNKISGTPTIPTDNSQLANSAGYITSAALTGLATQSYVTSRGYLTSVSWDDVSSKPTLFNGAYASLSGKPTLFSGSYDDLTNKPTIPSAYTLPTATDTILGGVKIGSNISINAGVISVAAPFSGSYSDLSNKPALFSGSYTDLTNKPTIPTDINQLTDASGLLGQGGGTGDYTLPTATNTVLGGVKIGSNISINAGVISVAAPFSGSYADLTNKPTIPSITGLATETYVTTRGYLTAVDYSIITGKPTLVTSYTQLTDKPSIPSITGLATETYVTTQGYITSSALTGLATETYVTTRGYLTAVDYSIITGKPTLFSGSYTDLTSKPTLVTSYTQLTDKPTLFSGSYTDLTSKPTLFSGSYTDLTDKPTIPSIVGLATESYVTTQGYITSSALTGLATETYVTTQGYITSSALTGLATESYVTTQGYITSSALTGLATESYVTTQGYITSSALTGLATETYVTTQGYITSSALTGLATESFVTTKGYLTAVDYSIITNTPAPYTWSIAADDSTLREILTSESIKFVGAGGITTASDAEGNITITGAVPDRLTSNNRSAILNSNGTFSLPSLTSAPATPQAGQMALANGTSWDPIAQNNGAPYMVMYTGTAWIGLGSGSGGVTVNQVYDMILEMG